MDRLSSLKFQYACVDSSYDWKEIRDKAKERSVEVVPKRVVYASNRMDVLQAGRRKKREEILSIAPSTREALIVSARDERVDTVIVTPQLPEIDRHILQVLRNFLEIPLEYFIGILDSDEFLKKMVLLFRIAERKELRLIISSGSSTELGLRSPRQLASIPEAFGFPTEKALDMVSNNPFFILEKRGVI